MIYSFLKMSDKWYGKQHDSVSAAASDIQAHVDNGDIVCLADDVECFADEIGIEVTDIEMVEGE